MNIIRAKVASTKDLPFYQKKYMFSEKKIAWQGNLGACVDEKDVNPKEIQSEATRFRSASPFTFKTESSQNQASLRDKRSITSTAILHRVAWLTYFA